MAQEQTAVSKGGTPARVETAGLPAGIPYIIGNEAAERFSYYGMRAILVVFMTQYLMNQAGKPEFSQPEAMVWYHNFVSANYFFPIIGAILSDIFWSKYKTIIRLSIVYCLGHLVLALFESRMGLATGLTLIAIGSGGIKPCVSAQVGDQFTEKNKHLLDKVFSGFYFAINVGAFLSSLATPILLDKVGPSVAFGIPGLLMFIATLIFWLGRNKYVAIPPAGWHTYKRDLFSKAGLKTIANLCMVYLFVAVFWALFDQTGSSWVLQADKMDRMVDLRFGPLQFSWLQFELLPSQIQAINPIMVLALIPVFTYGVYPFFGKFFEVTPLRRITVGFFVAAVSFMLVARAESMLQTGQSVSIMWQFWAYLVITAAEILVSITSLEFSYTQAPNSMKSFIMGLYLMSVTLGNQITAVVNKFIQDEHGNSRLSGSDYYWFFAYMMLGTAVVFIFVSLLYRGKTYIQDASMAEKPADL